MKIEPDEWAALERVTKDSDATVRETLEDLMDPAARTWRLASGPKKRVNLVKESLKGKNTE